MQVKFWSQTFEINMYVACIGGFFVAIIGSMLGFGGGPLLLPLMVLALGLPIYVALGSSLLSIFFNSVMGSVRHIQLGHFDYRLFLMMLPAAIMGGYIGPQIAKRMSPVMVKRIAAIGLLVLSLDLLRFI